MNKNFYTLVFILFTLFSYGQNINFQKNVNYKARSLKQNLSKNSDSLLLESKKTIKQVDIFNDDFFKSFDVDSTKTTIDLNKLPLGNFVVQARIGRKRIIMYLEKSEDISKTNVTNEPVIVSTNIKKSVINKNISSENRKLKRKLKQNPKKEVDYYWVVYESNAGFGAYKSMSLEYKEEVSELISQIKLELQSDVGRNNKLLVYEIYNKSKFMKKQFRNRDFYKMAKKSKAFNVVPFYNSENETGNVPES